MYAYLVDAPLQYVDTDPDVAPGMGIYVLEEGGEIKSRSRLRNGRIARPPPARDVHLESVAPRAPEAGVHYEIRRLREKKRIRTCPLSCKIKALSLQGSKIHRAVVALPSGMVLVRLSTVLAFLRRGIEKQ